MYPLNHHRVLALDVHNRLVGYTVFEGPRNVLDCGVKRFRNDGNATRVPLGIKIARLLVEWQPNAVVLKAAYEGRAAQKARTIQRQAVSFGVPVQLVHRGAIDDTFPSLSNKYERAHFVAGSLPHLATWLPPRRKPWQSEHYQMTVFDAAALGVAYFQRLEKSSTRTRENPAT